MSNVVQVPAHIAARIAARQQSGQKSAIASAVVSDGLNIPRISIRAGRYRLVEDGVETPVGINLDVVVVGANPRVSKVFYAGAYDASAENVRPACFSNDGLRPDKSVEQPVHSACADCPNNVLGSKILPSGAKSKMCADQRHLAVVPAADPTKVYSLTVPVSGMKGLREYFKELTNYGVGPEEAVTELGFDEQASYPKMTFKQKGYVPEKSLDRIDGLIASDAAKIATRVMEPTQAAPAIAAPTKPQLPLVDDAYEDEAEEASAPAVQEAIQTPPPKAAKEKPKVEPVKSSDDLAAKLDALFDE
jgi:hypothetical protein